MIEEKPDLYSALYLNPNGTIKGDWFYYLSLK